MKVNGIIAEYNPFHNGHKYLLEQSKSSTNADYTIIAMSGNFMQRGAPALLNKYKRAEMALKNGADLVLELPMYYATSSAEYFAMGGVSLLDKLNVVTHLSFGSECGDLSILKKIAKLLLEEPENFTELLRKNLRQGLSFPTARTNALMEYDPAFQEYQDVLSSPNNILGIEYLKALQKRNSSILPHTILRAGADYHDKQISHIQCSAQAIREAVFSNENFESLIAQMPQNAYELLLSCMKDKTLLSSNDFSGILHYKLLSEKEIGFTGYLDVTPELSDRICNNLFHYDSYRGFCDLLKTKDITYTRISRCLLHILLNIRTETYGELIDMDYTPYARVLGLRKEATPLLNAIKKNADIPLITKLADAGNLLPTKALTMLEKDISMNTVYESVVSLKSGQPMLNEYRTPIVIL